MRATIAWRVPISITTGPMYIQNVTARVRSTTGRYCFHRCLLTFGGGGTQSQVRGGYPIQPWTGGYLVSGQGEYLISGLGGYSISGLGGYPISGREGTQSQVQGGYLVSGMGGTPSQVRGYPISGWGGTQSQVQGGYLVSGMGVPHLRFGGVPPSKGKNFDTRFGLIHVQTGKKNFT